LPELPEVETIRRTLEVLVLGKTIEDVEVRWGKIIKEPDDAELFRLFLKGQTIREIGRRGKFLIFYLDDYSLVSHLRMEGKYGLFDKSEEMDKHTHVIFSFTDGTELRYRDVRKFGTMHLYPKGTELDVLPLSKVGPEPFSDEFMPEHLAEGLRKTHRFIKTVLLDQRLLAGLGNIYVDEALFHAGIHPERPASSLDKEEIERLYAAIKTTLADAIEKGGSTIRSYVNSQGQIGMFQLELFAYSRKGQPCKTCGTIMERIIVGGRGTVYCPSCQKRD